MTHRVAVLDQDLCQPQKCGLECIKYCPVNKSGAECVTINEVSKKAQIDEDICNGCNFLHIIFSHMNNNCKFSK